jgi:hypothetical protein
LRGDARPFTAIHVRAPVVPFPTRFTSPEIEFAGCILSAAESNNCLQRELRFS